MAVERSLPHVDLSEESQSERFARKAKEAPYVPIGRPTLLQRFCGKAKTNEIF
jgi:hypothetical protein